MMRYLLIASAAGVLFTIAQILIGRLLKGGKDSIESSAARRGGRRDEILWIAAASLVFVLVALLCLLVWERRSAAPRTSAAHQSHINNLRLIEILTKKSFAARWEASGGF